MIKKARVYNITNNQTKERVRLNISQNWDALLSETDYTMLAMEDQDSSQSRRLNRVPQKRQKGDIQGNIEEEKLKYLVKEACEGKIISEEYIRVLASFLSDEAYYLGLLYDVFGVIGGPLTLIMRASGYDVGNLRNTFAGWALQAFSYMMENEQLNTILQELESNPKTRAPREHDNSKTPTCSSRYFLYLKYKEALKEKEPLSRFAAIALTHLCNPKDAQLLPSNAEKILYGMLETKYTLNNLSFDSSYYCNDTTTIYWKETDSMALRTRALNALTAAIRAGHPIEEEKTFKIVKDFLFSFKEKSEVFFNSPKMAKKKTVFEPRGWSAAFTSYKEQALNNIFLTNQELQCLYQYIIKNGEIDYIWTLFFAHAWNAQELPLFTEQEAEAYSLEKVREKLSTLLNNQTNSELEFAAACLMMCITIVKTEVQTSREVINKHMEDYPKNSFVQKHGLMALTHGANTCNDIYKDIDKLFNPIRIAACELIAEYIPHYKPVISVEEYAAINALQEQNDEGLYQASLSIISAMLDFPEQYSQLLHDIDLDSFLVKLEKNQYSDETFRMIEMISEKDPKRITGLLLEKLCRQLPLNESFSQRSRANIIQALAYLMKHETEKRGNPLSQCVNTPGIFELLSDDVLIYLFERAIQQDTFSGTSMNALVEYARATKLGYCNNAAVLAAHLPKLANLFERSPLPTKSIERVFIILQDLAEKLPVDILFQTIFIKLINENSPKINRVLTILYVRINVGEKLEYALLNCLISNMDVQNSDVSIKLFNLLHYYNQHHAMDEALLLKLTAYLTNEKIFVYACDLLSKIIQHQRPLSPRVIDTIIEAVSLMEQEETAFYASTLLIELAQSQYTFSLTQFYMLQRLLTQSVTSGATEVCRGLLTTIIHFCMKNPTVTIDPATWDTFAVLLNTSWIKGKERVALYKIYDNNSLKILNVPVDRLLTDLSSQGNEVAKHCLQAITSLLLNANLPHDQQDYFETLIKKLSSSIHHPALFSSTLMVFNALAYSAYNNLFPKEIVDFCFTVLIDKQQYDFILVDKAYEILSTLKQRNYYKPELEWSLFEREQKARDLKDNEDELSQFLVDLFNTASEGKPLTRTEIAVLVTQVNALTALSETNSNDLKNFINILKIIPNNDQKILEKIDCFLKKILLEETYIKDAVEIVLKAITTEDYLNEERTKDIENYFLSENGDENITQSILEILVIQANYGVKLTIKTPEKLVSFLLHDKHVESCIAILLVCVHNEEYSDHLVKLLSDKNIVAKLNSLLRSTTLDIKVQRSVLSILQRCSNEESLLVKIKSQALKYEKGDFKAKNEVLKYFKEMPSLDEEQNLVKPIILDVFQSQQTQLFLSTIDLLKTHRDLMDDEILGSILSLKTIHFNNIHLLNFIEQIPVDILLDSTKTALVKKLFNVLWGNNSDRTSYLSIIRILHHLEKYITDKRLLVYLNETPTPQILQGVKEDIIELAEQGWPLEKNEVLLRQMLENDDTSQETIKACFILIQKGHQFSTTLWEILGNCCLHNPNDNLFIHYLFYYKTEQLVNTSLNIEQLPSIYKDRIHFVVKNAIKNKINISPLMFAILPADNNDPGYLKFPFSEYDETFISYLNILLQDHSIAKADIQNLLPFFKVAKPYLMQQMRTFETLYHSDREQCIQKIKFIALKAKLNLPYQESSLGADHEWTKLQRTMVHVKNPHQDYFSYVIDLVLALPNEAGDHEEKLSQLDKLFFLYEKQEAHFIIPLTQVMLQWIDAKKINTISELVASVQVKIILHQSQSHWVAENNTTDDALIRDMKILLGLGWKQEDLISINEKVLKHPQYNNSFSKSREGLIQLYQLMASYKLLPCKDNTNLYEEITNHLSQPSFQLKTIQLLCVGKVFCDKQETSGEQLLAEFTAQNPSLNVFDVPVRSPLIEACYQLCTHKAFFSNVLPQTVLDIFERVRANPGSEPTVTEWIQVFSAINQILSPQRLRLAQLIVICVCLHDDNLNVLAQMATGEGKSLILAIIALIKVLKGRKVDMVTSLSNFAERDAEIYQTKLYRHFNVKAVHNVPDPAQGDSEGVKACYQKDVDIVYGDAAQFQFDFLMDKFKGWGTRGGRPYQDILIDEADYSMLDQLDQMVRLADNTPGFDHVKVVYVLIWNTLNKMLFERVNSLQQQALTPTDAEKNAFMRQLPQDLEKKIRESLILKGNNDPINGKILLPEHLHDWVDKQLSTWSKNAIHVWFSESNKIEYKTAPDDKGVERILPLNFQYNGETQQNMQWSDGIHQFYQLKEGVELTSENLVTNFTSNYAYFRKYESMIGITGTLGNDELRKLLCEQYTKENSNKTVKCALFPSHKEKQCIAFSPQLLGDREAWLTTIIRSIQQQVAYGRSVLVICETLKNAEDVTAELKRLSPDAHVTCYIDSEDKISLSNVHMTKGETKIATNLAGRGTDIKLSEDVLKNGGLHVVMTFLPKNDRVLAQAIGRTARSGEPGTSELIIQSDPAVSLATLEQARDAQEIKTLKKQLEALKKGALQEKYLALICKELKEQHHNHKQTIFRFDWAQQFLVNTVYSTLRSDFIEKWGLWLAHLDLKKNKEELDEEFIDFLEQAKADYKAAKINSPCYALQAANELMGYVRSWLHTLSQCGTYRESFHNTIVMLCKSVKDPLFLAQTYDILAFTCLMKEDSSPENNITFDASYKEKAKYYFSLALQNRNTIILPQLAYVQSIIYQADTRSKDLEKQLVGKKEIESTALIHDQKAIENIERSRKYIQLTAGSIRIAKTLKDIISYLQKEEITHPIDLEFNHLRLEYDTEILNLPTRKEPTDILSLIGKHTLTSVIEVEWCNVLPTDANHILDLLTEEGRELVTLERKNFSYEKLDYLNKYDPNTTIRFVLKNLLLDDIQNSIVKDYFSRLKDLLNTPISINDFFIAMERLFDCFHNRPLAEAGLCKKSNDETKHLLDALRKNMKFDLVFEAVSMNIAKEEINHLKTDQSNVVVSFYHNDVDKINKVINRVWRPETTARIRVKALSKNQAINLLQDIQTKKYIQEEPFQTVKLRPISALFTDAAKRSEVALCDANGLRYLYVLSEQVPFKAFSMMILGSLALLEGGVGLTIATLCAASVFGFTTGLSFLTESISTVSRMIQLGITREHDWTTFWGEKLLSYSLNLISAGVTSMLTVTTAAGTMAADVAENVVRSAAKSTATKVSTHLSVNQVTTMTREILKTSAKQLITIASTGIGEMLSNEEFLSIENRLRAKVEDIIKQEPPKKWSVYLQQIFLMSHYCGIQQMNTPLAGQLQKAAENIISKSEELLNRPRALINLFIDGLEKQFMDEYIIRVNKILREHSAVSTFRHILVHKLSQTPDDETIKTMVEKFKDRLTDTGHMPELSMLARLNVGVEESKNDADLMSEAMAIYDDLCNYYCNNENLIKSSEALFQQKVIDNSVSVLHKHVVGLIQRAQAALTATFNTALNVSTGLVPKSVINLLQEGALIAKDTILSGDPNKWASRQPIRLPLLGYERIQNGRIDYYSPSQQEQLTDQQMYEALFAGNIPTDLTVRGEALCIEMIKRITNALINVGKAIKAKKRKNIAIQENDFRSAIYSILLQVVINWELISYTFSSDEKIHQIINQSKATMIRLIQDNNLVLWLADKAKDIAQFPNTIYHILKEDSAILVKFRPQIGLLKKALQREAAVDGFLNVNTLLFIGNLFQFKEFAQKLQDSISTLFNPNAFIKTAIELLHIPGIAEQIYHFIETYGEIYLDRVINENAENAHRGGLDQAKTYLAILTQYKLTVADLKLFLPALASIILEPASIEKILLAIQKHDKFQLMMVLYNHMVSNETCRQALKAILARKQEITVLQPINPTQLRQMERIEPFLACVTQSPGLIDTIASCLAFLLDAHCPLVVEQKPDNDFSFIQQVIDHLSQFDTLPGQELPFVIAWIKTHHITLKSLVKAHFSGRGFSVNEIAKVVEMIEQSAELKAAIQDEQQANHLTKLVLSILNSAPVTASKIQGLELKPLLTNLFVNHSLIQGLAYHQRYTWFKYLVLIHGMLPYVGQLLSIGCQILNGYIHSFIRKPRPVDSHYEFNGMSDYSGEVLMGLTLSEPLNNKRFVNTKLMSVTFQTMLNNIDFHGAIFHQVKFLETSLDVHTFRSLLPQLRDKNQDITFENCKIVGDLSQLDLSNISLKGISLRQCESLRETNIQGTEIVIPTELQKTLLFNTLGWTQQEYGHLLNEQQTQALHTFWYKRTGFLVNKICSVVIEAAEVEGIQLSETIKVDFRKIVAQQLYMSSQNPLLKKVAQLTHDFLNDAPQDITRGFHIKEPFSETAILLKFLYAACTAQQWQLTTDKLRQFILIMYMASQAQKDLPQTSKTKCTLFKMAKNTISAFSENISFDRIQGLITQIKRDYLNELKQTPTPSFFVRARTQVYETFYSNTSPLFEELFTAWNDNEAENAEEDIPIHSI